MKSNSKGYNNIVEESKSIQEEQSEKDIKEEGGKVTRKQLYKKEKIKSIIIIILLVLLFLIFFWFLFEKLRENFTTKLIQELIRTNVANDPEEYKKLQQKIKICLCVIVKEENRYLREFADYYFNVHKINKIFLYDNNLEDGEHPEEVLQDYIDKGLIEITHIRGMEGKQMWQINDCFTKHKMEYDWLMLYDADEYLHLNHNIDLRVLLNSKQVRENKCAAVVGNWLTMTDGDLTYYDNRKVQERFIKPGYPYTFKRTTDKRTPNHSHKSILKGGDWKDIDSDSSKAVMGNHTPNKCKLCDLLGRGWPFFNPAGMDFTGGYIKHYQKTAEEYAYKTKKGSAIYARNQFNDEQIRRYIRTYFFGINKVTKEKIQVFEKILNRSFSEFYPYIGRQIDY